MEINIKTIGSGAGIKNHNSAALEKTGKADIEKKADVPAKDIQTDKRDVKPDREELVKAVDDANERLFKDFTHLKFEIHEKTKEVMVRIVDDESGEVIKEIPPEKMLDMVAKLWEIAGILVDEKR